jgi:hypothetical protein
MKVSNGSLRAVNSWTIKNMLGIDLASTPTEVANFRATDMSNFIIENGTNAKRKGGEQQGQLPADPNNELNWASVRGIWEFRLNGELHKICYYNKNFYVIGGDKENRTFYDITTKGYKYDGSNAITLSTSEVDENERVKRQDLKDNNVQAFVRENKVFFVGCGDYLVLYRQTTGWYEIHKVFEDEQTYIPTTTQLITATTQGKFFEDVNLMTTRRKNTLVGAKAGNGQLTYELDSNINYNRPITIKVIDSEDAFSINKAGEVEVIRTAEVDDDISNKNITINLPQKLPYQGNWVVLNTEKGAQIYISFANDDKNKFFLYAKAIDATYGTLIATYTRANWLSLWYGKKQVDTINLGNCGKVTFSCTGWERLAEANLPSKTVTISKGENEIGTISGKQVTFNAGTDLTPKIADQGNIEITYSTTEMDAERINIIRNAKVGTVFGLNGTDNRLIVTDGTINEVFTEQDDFTYYGSKNTLASGTADTIGYIRMTDNSLGVLKGDNTQDAPLYIRTAKDIVTAENEQGQVVRREILFPTIPTNASVKAVGNTANATLGNDTMILTDQGIYGIELTDNIATNQRLLKSRSTTINRALCQEKLEQAVSIVDNNRLYLACGNRVYVADARYRYTTEIDMRDTFTYEWWKLDMPCNITCFGKLDNELVCGTDKGQILTLCGKAYYDKTYDTYKKGQISISNGKLIGNKDLSEYTHLLFLGNVTANGMSLKDKLVEVKTKPKGVGYEYELFQGGTAVGTLTDGSNQSDCIRAYKIKPVQAYWYSKVSDLGDCSVLKNLVSMTIAVDKNTIGNVNVGYEVRRSERQIKLNAASGFDFGDMDFNEFSFSPQFEFAHTRKVVERMFNYICLRIESNEPCPCGLNQIIVRYKNIKIGRGQR